jgi:hypothetical protein
MTSLQLAQRVISFTNLPSDPISIPADLAATLIGAINAGFAKYYFSAPSGRKTTPVTSFQLAPVSVSVGLTQGSRNVTGLTLSSDTDRIGDTLEVGDRKSPLGIGSTLRDPWSLATGTYTGLLYDDAIPLWAPIRRIEGSVIWDEDHRLTFLSEAPLRQDTLTYYRQSGLPAYYTAEYLGDTIGGGARALVRVIPLPTKASSIRFAASLEPQQLVLTDLQIPIGIYTPSSDIEAFLVPLIVGELATTSLLKPELDKNLIVKKASESLAFLKSYHEPISGAMNKMMTPVGF